MAAALAIAVLLAALVRGELRASLPQLDGAAELPGLRAPVTVERDELGVPTLRGESRLDVTRALGYLHAQDRFFQMDLLRRSAAGELSELFGELALEADRSARLHRFRAVASRAVAALAPGDREHLEAYTAGVNQGLGALGSKPFEYHMLRLTPAAWVPEDTLLAVYAMFLTLHDETGGTESGLGAMRDRLPPALFDFLTPTGTEWDAPLVGEPVTVTAIPGPEVLDLRGSAAAHLPSSSAEPSAAEAGSNNWAVAGQRTAHGGALVANDMHLGIRIPNTWYRASLVWPEDGVSRRVTGVTLPGTPTIVVGSNGAVAWGLTNSQGDWVDLVEIEVDPEDDDYYQTPDGRRGFERHVETIRVRGGGDHSLVVISTVWGPIVDRDHQGRPRALRWTAHEPEAINLGLLRMERAGDLDEALEIAAGSGLPPQNFVCAGADGRVGWTIIGRIPRRVGFGGRLPESWADGSRSWQGWLSSEEYPRVVDPPSGLIWTANARVVDGAALAKLGHGSYALGARARQIRDGLRSLSDPISERDLLAIQLDDRALFLERWQPVLLEALATGNGGERGEELRGLVEHWGGRASIDSVGYRAVRMFRHEVARRALTPLLGSAPDSDVDYLAWFRQQEGPLWRLVSERPAHLLHPHFSSWGTLFAEAAGATLDALLADGPELAQRTWGEHNTSRIRHPLSNAVPMLSRWLDMPRQPLPGDSHMPRVQHPANGASERLVVSPGREEHGFLHMPGGQSGHPLSPFYARGHDAWARGEATPFLPGPVAHRMTLVPY